MTRTFTEILTLMQRGAGRFADESHLKRLVVGAEVIELLDGPARKKPRSRRLRETDTGHGDVVVILPAHRGLPDNDGTLAYNLTMPMHSRGPTLILVCCSDPGDPFWFGLKAYMEWVRHVGIKDVLARRQFATRVECDKRLRECSNFCGELVAQALDEELGRTLSKHAPRRIGPGPRDDRETVLKLDEIVRAEVATRFPEPASPAEEITREHLISMAVCFAARGALAMKVA